MYKFELGFSEEYNGVSVGVMAAKPTISSRTCLCVLFHTLTYVPKARDCFLIATTKGIPF